MTKLFVAAALAAALAQPATAITFSKLTAIYVISGVRDDFPSGIATSITCTNVSGLTAGVRFQVLHSDGTTSGVFAVNLSHGHTVAVSTHDAPLFGESGTAGAGLIQGAANIEFTQSAVFCSAAILDSVAPLEFSFPLHIVRVNPHPGTVE